MPKGADWACVGDISNHTGIAQKPTNERKLQRTARFNP
ncbi:hypothetical protein COCOBI_pt-1440 (chloroplast) [Coccomyxa sp. Obi]|nr:hypothetical protein COCOBI_pt-1440 [Coccomyxa sp. Obi]